MNTQHTMAKGARHTFVVLAHGASPYLGECVGSLLAQTQKVSRVVVATSTPCEAIRGVAQGHGLELRVNPRRAGIGADWNFALDVAGPGLVTLAHQDDLYAPRYVERVLAAFACHPSATLATTGSDEVTPDGGHRSGINCRVKQVLTQLAFLGRRSIHRTSDKRRLLSFGNPVCCPAVTLDCAKLGPFRFSETLRSNLDWDAWARLALSPGAFLHVPEVLVSKRVHPGSETTALMQNNVRALEDRQMFERFWSPAVVAALMRVYRWGYASNRV